MDSVHTDQREQFRAASRRVLRSPQVQSLHQARVAAAAALQGAEPLQGALADWLYACPEQRMVQQSALQQPALQQGLGAVLWRKFVQHVQGRRALPRVNHLASRWSVLAQPSSDAPQRALLCGVDDSQQLAQAAVAAILASQGALQQQHQAQFLVHCLGAQDSLAFMLARRALQRAGFVFSAAWQEALEALLPGGGR